MSEPSPPAYRSLRGAILNVVVSLAVLSTCVWGFYSLGKRPPPERKKTPPRGGLPVVVQPAMPHETAVTLRSHGVVTPLREIRLAPEVSGRIVQQSERLRNGRRVRLGDPLITIEPVQFELEVRRLHGQAAQERAEADAVAVNLDNTQQLVVLAKQQLELAGNERSRGEGLVKQRAMSASELEALRRSELVAKSDLITLENRARELQAQQELIRQRRQTTAIAIERAELDLRRTKILSPIDGVVVSSTVEEQSYAQAGVPLAVIEDDSAVEVRCNLTVDEMQWIWKDAAAAESIGDDQALLPRVAATIRYQHAANEYLWDAVLERIDGAGIDPQTRTFPCLFRVDRPDQVRASVARGDTQTVGGPSRLMRGMFVAIDIHVQPTESLYRVPEIALRPGQLIWLARDSRLLTMPVEIVGHDNDIVIVQSPLLSGDDLLITSPIGNVREGMPLVVNVNGPNADRMSGNPSGPQPPGRSRQQSLISESQPASPTPPQDAPAASNQNAPSPAASQQDAPAATSGRPREESRI